jgi:hypothetical protein
MTAADTPPAAPDEAAGALALGFLTVLREGAGFVGGYLVVNGWGRPLEFRLTSAVQPNRVQQILYGGTLGPYVCADLIGRALVEKASVPARLVLTDREEALDLRLRIEAPVAWLAPADAVVAGSGDPATTRAVVARPAAGGLGPLLCHPRFEADADAVRGLLGRLDAGFDLAEPFQRVRDAVAEARKMGVAAR